MNFSINPKGLKNIHKKKNTHKGGKSLRLFDLEGLSTNKFQSEEITFAPVWAAIPSRLHIYSDPILPVSEFGES